MKQITPELTTVYTNPNCPYTVTGWAPVEDNPVKSELDIIYTVGERPSVITQDGKKAVLTYNANHDRICMQFFVNDSMLLARYYLGGNYEVDFDSTGTQERLYLGGDYYDAPAVLVKQSGRTSVYFIHRDYLGSILQISDMQGNVVEENSFDAWGCRRNPLTHESYATESTPGLMLGRGFTGHEHLPLFGLINMNARLYDPVLGRFLSPDPYVQMLDYTQAFNRYSYCMNSPLCYVDENGEFIWFVIGAAVIGGAINVATHWKSIDNVWQGLGYFGVGAAAGAIGAATGGIAGGAGFIGGAIGGFVGGATSGFTLGFGNTLMDGGSIGDAWRNGVNGALTGAVTGSVTGGLIGGGMSFIKGQNFWTGQNIAPGRNAFSIKNTPINTVEHPNAISFDNIPDIALLDNPTPAALPEPMLPNSPLSPELNPVLNQTPEGFTRFVTTPEGVTHDLLPTIERINSGIRYTFRHDGAVYWNNKSLLPTGNYTEYIHPTPGLVRGAGPMRVIVGNNGSWWFTPDHHLTFIRIKF